MAAAPPAPLELRVLPRMAGDVRRELRVRRRGRLPRGVQRPSARTTFAILADPLGELLDHHRRFGPDPPTR